MEAEGKEEKGKRGRAMGTGRILCVGIQGEMWKWEDKVVSTA